MVGENENSGPDGDEQDKHEETTQSRPIKPYRPSVPLPQRLAKAKLETNLGKFLKGLRNYKSISHS